MCASRALQDNVTAQSQFSSIFGKNPTTLVAKRAVVLSKHARVAKCPCLAENVLLSEYIARNDVLTTKC